MKSRRVPIFRLESGDTPDDGVRPSSQEALPRFGIARLYRDAGALAITSVANAVFGVAFWAIAAKMFEPHDLGVMTAILAVVTSTGVVAASGIGDSYTALLPAVGADRRVVYRRGQRLFAGLVIVVGIGAAVGTTSWLAEVKSSFWVGVLVFVGVLVWASLTLQNATLVALGRARWLPTVNVTVSVGKLLLLVVFAAGMWWHPLEMSVVVTAAICVMLIRPRILRIIDSDEQLPPSTIPDGLPKRHFYGFVGQTTLSSALGVGLFMVTPFLVTLWSTPAQGALFALSLSIVQCLDLLGAALTMSLVVHAASDPANAGTMARAILIRTVLMATLGAALIIVIAPTALTFLNPAYGQMGAASVITVLAVGTVCRLAYQVWQGLHRARRSMAAPLILNVVAAAVLVIMPGFCHARGALGGAEALLLAQLVMIAGIGIHFFASRNRLSVKGAG